MKISKKEYALEEFIEVSWREHIRIRPYMFLGNNGIESLFEGLFFDCIHICETDKILFKLELLTKDEFKLSISSKGDLSNFFEYFEKVNDTKYSNYFPFVLKSLSKKFEAIKNEKTEIVILFSFDSSINIDINIDYFKLSELTFQVALLHRKCEIILIDKRRKYHSKNYFHFPEGVFYLFEKGKRKALREPEFNLMLDEEINNKKYQIGIAFRTDWEPELSVISYANNYKTSCGGSLVDGIIDGLVLGCKKYVNENNLATFKIKRNKFFNGLILVCAIRGSEFNYGGSFRETLEEKSVRNEIKKVISRLVFEYLNSEKEIAEKFLFRFDSQHISSGMY